MNDRKQPNEDNVPEAEWQAQERALRAELLGLSTHADDATAQSYRAVARALRKPLPDPLPSDFARQMADQVAARPSIATAERLESSLIITLLTALAAAALILAGLSGQAWWHATVTLLPRSVIRNPWLLSLATCAAITALLGRWPRLPDSHNKPRARL